MQPRPLCGLEATMKFHKFKGIGLIAIVLGSTALIPATPALARLLEPGLSGPISDGRFGGVSLRPVTTSSRRGAQPAEVADKDCYLVREDIPGRAGAFRVLRFCR
jgi:hypothetical protein